MKIKLHQTDVSKHPLKTVAFLFFFVGLSLAIQAQQEAAIWYFGNRAGLDFRGNTPVPLTDGQMNTWEGCSTISDSSGNLLFYTDGIRVWNRNHRVMTNGTGLLGNRSSTQSALIVPSPGNPDSYYVFTADYEAQGGVHYSEVDMTASGGLGAITNKNIQLDNLTSEKLMAVEHANGRDFWVITHDWGNDAFLAYLVSPAGVSMTPVTSNTGFNINYPATGNDAFKAVGTIKASSDGSKLAVCHFNVGVELLDFNTATGRVSNPLVLMSYPRPWYYSTEFSPCGNALYVSMTNEEVFQFDLTAADIPSSLVAVSNPIPDAGALQLAIDGKIYMAHNTGYLSVIHNPEVVGLGCDFEFEAVDLGTGSASVGLPVFVASFFNVGFTISNTCFGEITEFRINSSNPISGVTWDFGDGNTSTLENPTHIYSTPGTYLVSATATTTSGTKTESKNITIYETPMANTVTDFKICSETPTYEFDLSTKDTEVLGNQLAIAHTINYYSTFADAENGTNPLPRLYTTTNASETVFARISNSHEPNCNNSSSCFDITSFDLISSFSPQFDSISDWTVCDTDGKGFYDFDLSEKNAEILKGQNPTEFFLSYHVSQADADAATNAISLDHTLAVGTREDIFVRVQNRDNTICYNTTSFGLEVYNAPVPRTVTNWQICDDNNDGTFIFDLYKKDMEILGTEVPSGFSVNYYATRADLDSSTNAITEPFQNTDNPQTVYYSIENNTGTACSFMGSFDLEVIETPIANMVTPIIVCDTNGTGVQTFNLTEKDTEVLGSQDANIFSVAYFASQADADNAQNPLSKAAYTNLASQETLYARIQNNRFKDCYTTTSFELNVHILPQPQLQETYIICPNAPELTIDGGDFESWSWRNGNDIEIGTARAINITALGNYSLTATTIQNGLICEKTVPFEVISSGTLDDFMTEIIGFGDQITVDISAMGTGEFEYSLDGENFQDSSRLEVSPGKYTLYVRDKFLCLTLQKEIIALGYQKFFTPNGDGIHEYWKIIGAEYYPDSVLYIYDRYGKLLSQIVPASKGWDGMYRGRPLPSTDYWFTLKLGDGREYKNHFTLKR